MEKVWEVQQKRITNISLSLRKKYYSELLDDSCYFDSPHGIDGNMSESIGAWPEFIFRGTFCRRTFKGYCSPCFYSQFPLERKETGDNYIKMVRKQFDYVIDNFEELVVKRQFGSLQQKELDAPITFVMTPTGSYFDDAEFPQELRIEMLYKLATLSKNYKMGFHLLIECHCKDWNKLDFNSEYTKYEIDLLKKLNTRVLFGFESANEYIRNVLYNKNLEMQEFTSAYKEVMNNGLETGIFIFAGLFSMNDALTYKDVCNSICFALDRNIAPVIMFQNVQQYTITDVLFQAKQINLIEPFTVMEIVLLLITEIEKRGMESMEWLIADPKGGPPVPEFNIFDCAKITSQENAEKIYDMICELRLTRNRHVFILEAQDLRETRNYREYQQMLQKCFKYDHLPENTDRLLLSAENIINMKEVKRYDL